MKQAEATVVKMSSDIFGDKALILGGNYEVTFDFIYPEDGSSMLVTMKPEGQEPIIKVLTPGDQCIMHHKLEVETTRCLEDNQVFPILLKFAGQEYKLNRTKQNKLILTK